MSITFTEQVNLEEEMISNMLEENIAIKDKLDGRKKKPKKLSYQEKKLILSEVKDIEDITLEADEIIFSFKPMSLYLDNGGRSSIVSGDKMPFYYLWRLGFIDFKTSKVKVYLKIVSQSIQFRTVYENNLKRNPHDWGFNCWGGWSATIRTLIQEKKYYDVVINIAARMKQITVNDYAASLQKFKDFQYETNNYVYINDQEFNFYKTEIDWVISNLNAGRFQKDDINDNYFIYLNYQDHTYTLAISNEMYNTIERR